MGTWHAEVGFSLGLWPGTGCWVQNALVACLTVQLLVLGERIALFVEQGVGRREVVGQARESILRGAQSQGASFENGGLESLRVRCSRVLVCRVQGVLVCVAQLVSCAGETREAG